jgi:pimeloyl-ACP methyl ester carboxylesterase
MKSKRSLAVFVHGLGSEVDVFWGSTIDALQSTAQLSHVDIKAWGYDTSSRPRRGAFDLLRRRRLQTIEQIGEHLWSQLAHWYDTGDYESVVLFGHSMGGLVVAAAVEGGLRYGRDTKLIASFAGIALCATPLGGADLADKLGPLFRLCGENVQVRDLRKGSPTRRRFVVRFINRCVAPKKDDAQHRRIDLLLFRASADAIVSQSEMTEPFGDLDVAMKVLMGSHSGCVQNLGRPGDSNFEMIARWVEQRTLNARKPPDDLPPEFLTKSPDAPDTVAPGRNTVDALEPPPIRVGKATDGMRIAFWTMGTGVPLLIPPPGLPFSNVELELENPLTRGWYERLARFCRPVRYDARGSGLSDDSGSEFSLAAYVQDVDAVARHFGDEKVALFGGFHGGPIAIRYAAEFPERVSHLILWCTYAEASAFWNSTEVRAFNALLTANWDAYTQTVAGTAFGWKDEQIRGRMAHFLQHCLGQESAAQALSAIEKFDVRDLLSKVTVPTLVLHSNEFRFISPREATRLASEIPGAILETMPEGSGVLLAGDPGAEEIAQTLERFLGTQTVHGALSTSAKAVASIP